MNDFPGPENYYYLSPPDLEKEREWAKAILKDPILVIDLDTLKLRPPKYK